ncbi:MAG TPA: J domain-containing protein [bacterium]|nr:J domain-containing protein [bacterium]
MKILNSLTELEQKLAVEKFSGIVRLCPADEGEMKAVWTETGRLQNIYPELPIFLVKGILGDDSAEEATQELLRENGHNEKFLLLPLYWIVWRGAIPAIYKQSGMIVRDLLSMFGGKDPTEAVAAWIETTMGVERGTGKLKPRGGAKQKPRESVPEAPTRTRAKEPHVVLGVAPTADENTIRTAYRKLCAKYHPDKYAQASKKEQDEATRRMTEINAAYDALKKKA